MLLCVYMQKLCMCVLSHFSHVQLFATLWTVDCSPPGSSVHGILQARILEWVAMPTSGASSQLKDLTHISHSLLHWLVGSLSLALPGKQPMPLETTSFFSVPMSLLTVGVFFVCFFLIQILRLYICLSLSDFFHLA